MKMTLKSLAAVAILGLWSVGAQAATVTWTSVNAPADPTVFEMSCTACDMLAFLDNDGEAYSGGSFDLAGSLAVNGSAWVPVAGTPGSRNPSLTGDAEQTAFLTAVATALGDNVIDGSYQKTDTTDPNAAPGSPTAAGDYFLWKSGQYAGVGKILSIGDGNVFTYSGTPGLSHIAHISTETTPVPLPAAGWMLIAGVGGLVAMRRRKQA